MYEFHVAVLPRSIKKIEQYKGWILDTHHFYELQERMYIALNEDLGINNLASLRYILKRILSYYRSC